MSRGRRRLALFLLIVLFVATALLMPGFLNSHFGGPPAGKF